MQASSFKQLFHNMAWHDILLYLAMLSNVVLTTIDWHLGVWALIALVVASVVKIAATRRLGNPMLDNMSRWALALVATFWLLNLLSALRSDDISEGLSLVSLKLPILAFALIFLLCDTSAITSRRTRQMMMLFVLVLIIRFLYFATIAALKMAEGVPVTQLTGWRFDPLHHNYLSMYLLLGIGILYGEVVRPRKERIAKLPFWLYALTIILLSAYILIGGSRSGLIAWFFVLALCLGHSSIVNHFWKESLIMAASIVLFALTLYWIEPFFFKRFLTFLDELQSGALSDMRIKLYECGLQVFGQCDTPLVGYGCGDCDVILQRAYFDKDMRVAYMGRYSTHNEYIETLVSLGYIGLFVLISIIVLPLYRAFKKHRTQALTIIFTIIYASGLFFETMLRRQMGLLFIFFWYCILLAYSNDNSQPKAGRDSLSE